MKIFNNDKIFLNRKSENNKKFTTSPINNFVVGLNLQNLSPLSQDTVSFGSKTASKKEPTTKELVLSSIDNPDEYNIDDISRAVDYTYNRLSEKGIKLSKEDAISIAKNLDFSTNGIVDLTNMQNAFGRAFILDLLVQKDSAYIENMKDVVGMSYLPAVFTLSYKDNFAETLLLGGMDYTDVYFYEFLAQKVQNGEVETKIISDFIKNDDLSRKICDFGAILPPESVFEFIFEYRNEEEFKNVIDSKDVSYKKIREYYEQKIHKSVRSYSENLPEKEVKIFDGIAKKQYLQHKRTPSDVVIPELIRISKEVDKGMARLREPEFVKFGKEVTSNPNVLFEFAYMDDREFEKFKEIIQDEEFFKKLDLTSIYDIVTVAQDVKPIAQLAKEGHFVNAQDAVWLSRTPEKKELYGKFLNMGIDGKIAVILANIEKISEYPDEKLPDLVEFLTLIKAQEPSKSRTSAIVSKFLQNNSDLDIKALNEYIKTLDFAEIVKIAPAVSEFQAEQYLNFTQYHFKNGTKEFNSNTLTFDKLDENGGLTNFLIENYISEDELGKILTVFPATSSKVGTLPSDWLCNIKEDEQKQAIDDFYSAVDEFQKDDDDKKFKKKLSEIFNRDVSVEFVGSGNFGMGYKLSADGAIPLCLKVFDKIYDEECSRNIHGRSIEPQTALFVNENSNKFVKMFCAKLSQINRNDGFMVTQFLDENIIPIETAQNNPDYQIASYDVMGKCEHNIINGKIFDFGGVYVENASDYEAFERLMWRAKF